MIVTAQSLASHRAAYDVGAIRADFPILSRQVHGRPLVYLDTAATAQRPRVVIDAVTDASTRLNANVHRGVHTLSMEATDAFEAARNVVRRFVNAREAKEVIFTRGATEAINLVAHCWARTNLKAGDEIILSQCEHHSNIVPWQFVREWTGAVIRVIPVSDRGELDLDSLDQMLNDRTRVVAVQHVSNTLGTIHPLKEIARRARHRGAIVVVDGAQAGPHLPIDIQDLDADFYAVSGHKMYGPTGIGALIGRRTLLEAMPPWLGGGAMIRSVTFERTTYADLPDKFEAGTPNIAGAIGLGAAIDYLTAIGLERIEAHEAELTRRAIDALAVVPGVRLLGAPTHRAGVISFVVEGVHPHDVGTILDREGIAIRTGHHCTQPLMERFGVPATCRASFGMYTTREEVERLVAGLKRVREVFAA